MRSVVVAIAFASACTTPQARTTRSVAEASTAIALGGLLASIVAAQVVPDDAHEFTTIGVVFVPVSVMSALVYVVADSVVAKSPPESVTTRRERRRLVAWELTKQAAAASRLGDCSQVQALDPRVRDLDAELHLVVFMRDVAIRRCLAQAP
jgi:hypothetical protein